MSLGKNSENVVQRCNNELLSNLYFPHSLGLYLFADFEIHERRHADIGISPSYFLARRH